MRDFEGVSPLQRALPKCMAKYIILRQDNDVDMEKCLDIMDSSICSVVEEMSQRNRSDVGPALTEGHDGRICSVGAECNIYITYNIYTSMICGIIYICVCSSM